MLDQEMRKQNSIIVQVMTMLTASVITAACVSCSTTLHTDRSTGVNLPPVYDDGNIAEFYGRCPKCNAWVKGYLNFWDGTDSRGNWASGSEYMGKCTSCGTQVYADDDVWRAWGAPRILQWKTRILQAVTAYRVKTGDTLWAIAQKLGVPVKDIVAANGLTNPNRITVDQEIIIPPAKEE